MAMPPEDLDKLYNSGLYDAVWRKGFRSKGITDITLHLACEDIGFSKCTTSVICKGIHELDYNECAAYFDILTPFLSIQDFQTTPRMRKTMKAYLKVIEDNMKFKLATSACIKYLEELVQVNPAVRHWVVEKMDNWLDGWLLAASTEIVRERAYHLVLRLLDSGEGDTTSVEMARKVTERLFQSITSAQDELDEDIPLMQTNAWHIVHYTRLLRHVITQQGDASSLSSHLVWQHREELLDLLIACDDRHFECDANKHELSELWLTAMRNSPELVEWATQHPRAQRLLLDFFVVIQQGKKYRLYNEHALPAFYNILSLCCNYESFLHLLADHNNLDWAVRHLFLEYDDFPSVATVIREILAKMSVYEMHRQRRLETLLCSPGIKCSFYHLSHLFGLMLQTRADVIFFYEFNGLEFIKMMFLNNQNLNTPPTDPLYFQFSQVHTFLGVILSILLKAIEHPVCPSTQAQPTPYFECLISMAKFVLHSPDVTIASPRLSTSFIPINPLPLIPTAIEIAVQTTRDAYIQHQYYTKHPLPLQSTTESPLALSSSPPLPPPRSPPPPPPLQPHPQPSSEQSQQPPQIPQAHPHQSSFIESLALLYQIWNDVQYGPTLRENQSFKNLVPLLAADGFVLLDGHSTAEAIVQFYTHCALHRSAIEKYEFLCRLAEHTTQVVHHCTHDTPDLEILTQISNSIQLALSLEIDEELKTQFIQTHEPIISSLLSSLPSLPSLPSHPSPLSHLPSQTHEPIISSLKALLLQYQEKSNKNN